MTCRVYYCRRACREPPRDAHEFHRRTKLLITRFLKSPIEHLIGFALSSQNAEIPIKAFFPLFRRKCRDYDHIYVICAVCGQSDRKLVQVVLIAARRELAERWPWKIRQGISRFLA